MFTHTGPRRSEFFAESTFAKQIVMIEMGLSRPIIYVGNLKSFRTICDVRDAVRAYYMVVTKNPIAGSIYNIGGSKPVSLIKFINILEKNLGKKAKIKYFKLQKGDVKKTHASNAKLIKKINIKSKPPDIKYGIKLFVDWYKNFYD
jgi:nucleoside-diphosphate-sugar epimerase